MTSVVLRNIARGRCCSFCRVNGHNINNCNDERITDFENLCKAKKEMFDDINSNRFESKNQFENWLMEYSTENINIVKAFSISRCNGLLRDTIDMNIIAITRHIYCQLYQEEMEDDNDDDIPPLIDTSNDLFEQFHDTYWMNQDFIPFEARQPLADYSFTPHTGIIYNFLSNNSITIDPNALSNLSNQARYKTPQIKVVNMTEELTDEKIDENLYLQHDCNICYDTKDHYEFVKLNCEHEFCSKCVIETIKMCENTNKQPFCGFCRKDIDMIQTRSEEVKAEIDTILE